MNGLLQQQARWCGLCRKPHPARSQCPLAWSAPSRPDILKREPRPPAAERGYDARWRKLRDLYIRAHPLCEHCLAAGRTVPAREVDHIIPHGGDDALRLAEDNLQALCSSCHRRKHARAEAEA